MASDDTLKMRYANYITQFLPLFAHRCKDLSYDVAHLPATSVIICFHNEAWSVLIRTIKSVLDRSPAHLISEIILVDDFSDKEHLGQQLDDYAAGFDGKIKVVRASKREGLIRARLLGFEVASGPVVTYLDSHCEVREMLMLLIGERDNV
jgi:polypeptide N-acetylgalactosaminyltransferase